MADYKPKAQPKKKLDGDLIRKTYSPKATTTVDFEMYGYHSNPATGAPAKGESGAKRKKK